MRKSIAIIAATPLTVNFFLRDQIKALSRQYQVSVVVNATNSEELGELAKLVELIPMKICREVSILADIAALWHLYRLFYHRRFDLVHSFTPKAGLLCMLAARLAGIKCRVHTFTGQVWATRKGVGRWVLKQMDKLLAGLATIVLVDSHSQRDFIVAHGIVSESRSQVLADGSISGVNLNRFYPDVKRRNEVRQELAIAENARVILYLGRLKRDKGVLDLVQAFLTIHQKLPIAEMLFVGPDEDNLLPEIMDALGESACHLKSVPYTRVPEYYMRAADILCLPSYREGFGSVIIEAAACEIPVVASRIYGLTDAVVDGETGLLVKAADVPELAKALIKLATNDGLRVKQGLAARKRAECVFSQERITQELLCLYAGLLVGQGAQKMG